MEFRIMDKRGIFFILLFFSRRTPILSVYDMMGGRCHTGEEENVRRRKK
jgi:hypothetical protein